MKSETPSAVVVQISDGRLLRRLIDGNYGIWGLTIVVLIEAGIANMSRNIQKRAMNIGKPIHISMMSVLMLHSSSI